MGDQSQSGASQGVTVRYNESTDSFYLPRTVFGRDEAVDVANQILSKAEDARYQDSDTDRGDQP